MNRDWILGEIRRLAEETGRPPGYKLFARETGVRERDWRGRYWARWSDALREAGFEPNQLNARHDDEAVLRRLADETRQLGRLPTEAERQLKRRADPDFPSERVFRRLGPRRTLARQLADYCRRNNGYEDVLAAIGDVSPEEDLADAAGPSGPPQGFVYLLKSGRHYKIGKTFDVGRRRYDLAIQLPDPVKEIHAIATDDPAGIERYWHARFADRHTNGEWFDLTAADVSAFKRRKFM